METPIRFIYILVYCNISNKVIMYFAFQQTYLHSLTAYQAVKRKNVFPITKVHLMWFSKISDSLSAE